MFEIDKTQWTLWEAWHLQSPAQRAGCPLYSRTGEAGLHRRSGFCQFHRLRIRTFTPIGEKWIQNTPAEIADQSSGCRPDIFS